MVHPLIGIHAALGEFAIFCFIWVFVEMLNPDERRVKRAKAVASVGLGLLLIAWVAGGYYYVHYYASNVKPIIKAGPWPWAHEVFMEIKEHLFLFLPFLMTVAVGTFYANSPQVLATDKKRRLSILVVSALVILLGLAMAGMGFMISSGARAALEAAA